MLTRFDTIAIVGVGLIGGSFGLALRKEGFTGTLLGVSSPDALEAGLQAGAISSTASLEQAAASADLIYLAQPVNRIIQTIEALGPLLRPGCLVTDAGSTKAVIVETASAYLPPGSFIGGHPLAGKESRGAQASEASLFRGRPYVLTPVAPEPLSSAELRDWIERMGARVVEMSAAQHDATVALTSHLPQLISTALAKTLADQPNLFIHEIFGTGLLDMTRLALSSSDLWTSILTTNQVEVTSALDAYLASLTKLREALRTNSLDSTFDSAADFAAKIRKLDFS